MCLSTYCCKPTCTHSIQLIFMTFKHKTMPGDYDATDHKGQLSPFDLPKFHWGQDNKQFKSFKRVVEFAFKGQEEKCSNVVLS